MKILTLSDLKIEYICLPPDHSHNSNNTSSKEQESPNENNATSSRTANFFSSAKKHLLCKTCKRNSTEESTNVPPKRLEEETEKTKGCFSCLKKKQLLDQNITIKVEEAENEAKETFWNRWKCCRSKNKIDEQQGCLPFRKRKSAWKERRDSILSDATNRTTCANRCKNFMKKLLCLHLCEKKKNFEDLSVSRRASMLSKKKSLTPTTQPLEDRTPKLDLSLVEHTSHMKAAIPVLPICLAWFCLVMNCLLPGTGKLLFFIFNSTLKFCGKNY
ncbi:hypothetical protein WA026_012959 [Henosepilachna vigintioctopunctata]|uniref:Uncharacterized protein n=1 Tax=Henosepilachna vigintioctopunctata TaxID=420089 RepID=A0AAW1TLJ4_9CUCU